MHFYEWYPLFSDIPFIVLVAIMSTIYLCLGTSWKRKWIVHTCQWVYFIFLFVGFDLYFDSFEKHDPKRYAETYEEAWFPHLFEGLAGIGFGIVCWVTTIVLLIVSIIKRKKKKNETKVSNHDLLFITNRKE